MAETKAHETFGESARRDFAIMALEPMLLAISQFDRVGLSVQVHPHLEGNIVVQGVVLSDREIGLLREWLDQYARHRKGAHR